MDHKLTETIPHRTDVSAAVTPAAEVQPRVALWHESGRVIEVAEPDVAFWLAQGFHTFELDVASLADEARAAFDAARDAMLAAVEGVVSDGVIDPADEKALASWTAAMRNLAECVQRLHTALWARFPVAQQEEARVRLRNRQGAVVEVLAQQAEYYRTVEGYTDVDG